VSIDEINKHFIGGFNPARWCCSHQPDGGIIPAPLVVHCLLHRPIVSCHRGSPPCRSVLIGSSAISAALSIFRPVSGHLVFYGGIFRRSPFCTPFHSARVWCCLSSTPGLSGLRGSGLLGAFRLCCCQRFSDTGSRDHSDLSAGRRRNESIRGNAGQSLGPCRRNCR
jgi:hypothetical protein